MMPRMSQGGAATHPVETCGMRGFSLLELLVAMVCTMLVAGAIASILVGTASASRREWTAIRARGIARAAVSGAAGDIARAGIGLERASAVQHGGERIPIVSSNGASGLRVVRTLGDAVEIAALVAPGVYEVETTGALVVGGSVVGVDLPGRPAAAPLPVGRVAALYAGIINDEVVVAWSPSEALNLAAWGEPRALVPVRIREYEARPRAGALQLRRRDEGGSWQPIADGLEEFRVTWTLDTDGDGIPDARATSFSGPGSGRACALSIEAGVQPWRSRSDDPPAAPARRTESASRWIDLPAC